MFDAFGTAAGTQPEPPQVREASSRGRRWLFAALGSLMGALILAAGAGGWWLANVTLVASHENESSSSARAPVATTVAELQMPDVRGLDRATAEQVLADSGIPLDVIVTHDAPSVARQGVVVEQSPAFGASDISTVDLGLAVPVTMPDLSGKTQDEAVEILSGFGAGVSISYAYSKDAPAGTVLTGDPAVGEPLAQTAAIVVATAGSTLPLTQLDAIAGRCGSESNVAIDGHDFATALSCAVPVGKEADTTWMLSKAVDRFTATVGIADDGMPGSTVPYQILLDGNAVAQGTASFGASTTVDIPCAGAIQLTIRVGPAAAERIKVVFGDAVVYGAEQGITRLANMR